MQGFSQNPIMALLANLRRPQIYDGNPFQMAGQQQAEAQVDAVGAPPPAPAQAPAPPSPQRDRPGTPARRPSLWRALSSGLVDGGIAAGMDREEARIAGLDARDAAANTLRVRAEAFRASVGEDGQFNPQAYLRAHADAGIPIDPTDIKSLLETGRPNFNDVTVGNIRYRVGEDGQYTEVARDSTPDWRKGPDRNGDGEEDWFNANPGPPASSPRPGTPPSSGIVPPELLQGAKPLNPTSAAPSGAAAPQGNVNYSAPFGMAPSSPFGPRTPPKTRGGRGSRNHGGIDYPVGIGTVVPSAADGEVIFAGPLSGYGNTVKVRHRDGSITQYSHLRSPSVRVGDPVAAGAPVGESGDTGNVSGPHLHFGAYDAQGRPFDPATRYRR